MHLGIALPKFNWKEYVEYLEKQMTNKDHIERTKRMIEVMQAYVDGEEVEWSSTGGMWHKMAEPFWPFNIMFRVKKTPDTINWDHVAPEFKYMARDENGFSYLYKDKPYIKNRCWETDSRAAKPDQFSSYRKGTIDWKESLVIRPGCE